MAVQTLELQISDNAAQAASNVNKLASAMQRLQNAVQLGGIKELADRLRQISGLAGGGPVGEMATAFGSATKQIEVFSAALEKAVSALSGLRSGRSSSALGKVADDARKATEAMQEITVKDGPLGGTTQIQSATEAVEDLGDTAHSARTELSELGRAMQESGGWKPGIAASDISFSTVMPKDERGMIPSPEAMIQLAGTLATAADRVASSAPRASEALGQMVSTEPAVEQTAEAMQELATATGHLGGQSSVAGGELKTVASLLEHSAQKLDSLKMSATDAPAAMHMLSASFNVLKNSIGGLLGGLGGLLKGFMRIAKFRLFRAVLRAITTAFKEGMENVREYSKAINGLYAKDMENFDNAVLKMKNSLGASLAVAFQALLPLIHSVINALIDLANIFNQLVAMFSGHATWTKAVDVAASDFEKTKKSATGAAKAAKNLLASWDELNIIQSKSGGGGSGSGGLESADYTKMFEEAEFAPWVQWVKDHLTEIKSLAIGIGAAFLAWKIANALPAGLVSVWRFTLGIGLAIAGAAELWQGFADQLENGVNWDNLKKSVRGVALIVAGLGLAFGLTGLAVGLLAGGIALAINPLKELAETGKMSDESMTQLSISIGMIGGAISILTGSWIPLLIAGIAIGVAWIIQKWDDIVAWWNENVQPMLEEWGRWWSDLWENHFAPKVEWVNDNVTMPIAEFFTALWGTITGDEANNLGVWWNNLWENDLGEKVQWVDDNITAPIAGFFIGLWGSIQGDENTNLGTWWSGVWEKQFLPYVAWVETNITGPIAGYFSTMWGGIFGDANDENSFGAKFKEGWEGLVTWFDNNVTIPINNFFIDCANGVLEAINWVIRALNSMNFTIPAVDVGFIHTPEVTVGISGIQELELLHHIGERGTGTTGSVPVGSPGRSRNATGTGSIGGYMGDGSVGPVYYPAKHNLPSYDLGVTNDNDPQMNEQNGILRQIEAIAQDIRNKPFTVNITPSANLGRVVTESQNRWERASGSGAGRVSTPFMQTEVR